MQMGRRGRMVGGEEHRMIEALHLGLALSLDFLQAMGVQRYIFFSIHDCDKHPAVPLMNIKTCTEEFLRASGLDFTILRLCGFHQVRGRGSGNGSGSGRVAVG